MATKTAMVPIAKKPSKVRAAKAQESNIPAFTIQAYMTGVDVCDTYLSRILFLFIHVSL